MNKIHKDFSGIRNENPFIQQLKNRQAVFVEAQSLNTPEAVGHPVVSALFIPKPEAVLHICPV